MGIAFSIALAVKLLLEGRKLSLGTDGEGWRVRRRSVALGGH